MKKTKSSRRRRVDPVRVTQLDALELRVRELAADVQELAKGVGTVADQYVAVLEDSLREAIRFGNDMIEASDELAGEDMEDERAEYQGIVARWRQILGPRRETCTADRGECPVHKTEHGREAEELRAGIEKILRSHDGHIPYALRHDLLHLLDDVDARDSLAYLEQQKEITTP